MTSEINPGSEARRMDEGGTKIDMVDWGEGGQPPLGSGGSVNPGSDDINWGEDQMGQGAGSGPKTGLPGSLGPHQDHEIDDSDDEDKPEKKKNRKERTRESR
jgi:hypothetical protein